LVAGNSSGVSEQMSKPPNPHHRHRFPAELISHAWPSDEAGAAIEPHPAKGRPCARRMEDRRVINGILHVLRSGFLKNKCGAPPPALSFQSHEVVLDRKSKALDKVVRLMARTDVKRGLAVTCRRRLSEGLDVNPR
jgi:hypothetical protein